MTPAKPVQGTRRAVRPDDAQQRRKAASKLRRSRRIRSSIQRIRRRLGLPQVIVIQGVRYTERDLVPLHQAMSPRGSGIKEFVVRFPAGQGRMRIRCTRERIFADLFTDPRLPACEHALARLRPGMRVLEIGCGTGSGSARIAQAVGPSGGVVALNKDRESIRFARRRYRFDHLAFEIGSIETLGGELDGAFDAAFAHYDESLTVENLAEIWRCVAPGGWMLLHQDQTTGSTTNQPAFKDTAGLENPAPGVFIYDRSPEKPVSSP